MDGDREKLLAMGVEPELAENLSFGDALGLVRQLLALAAKYPTLIPLAKQLFAAVQAKDWQTVLRVAVELVALFAPASEPTPAPAPIPEPADPFAG